MKEFILEYYEDGEPIQPSLEIGKNQCKNCRYWDQARLMKDMPIQANGTIQDAAPCKLRLYEAAIIHNCPEAVFFMAECSPCRDDSFRFSGKFIKKYPHYMERLRLWASARREWARNKKEAA